jgi:hypothetical protein
MNGSPYSVASPAFTGFANAHQLLVCVELVLILLVYVLDLQLIF